MHRAFTPTEVQHGHLEPYKSTKQCNGGVGRELHGYAPAGIFNQECRNRG